MSATRVKWIYFILLGGCLWQCLAANEVCMPASAGRLGGTLGVYNSTRYPASMFRNESDRMYFRVWPEDISNPRFRFFCQDGSSPLSLSNFTLSCDQRFAKLDPRPYYDVGTANDLQPYYKHWTYSEIIPTTDIQIWCERRDMRRLYSHRIWRNTLLPAVVTTIVLVIIVELTLVTLLCISLWRRGQLKQHFAELHKGRSVHKFLVKYLGGHDTIADGLHLLLLVMAGFCMIEGISHSSTTSWRSTCMLDAAVMYTYLTLFAVLSSFARQLATARRETARDMRGKTGDELEDYGHEGNDRRWQRVVNQLATARRETARDMRGKTGDELEDYGHEGNDWRWQRVFNQFAVVILMTAFLSYNENSMGTALDSLVSVIWSVIMVAATWSIGVSIVIGARSVLSLTTSLRCSGRPGAAVQVPQQRPSGC